MADKFFIFGAAYDGDGTASNEAASAGAAGAWSQESIFTGTAPTYGSLPAGSTVHIRSKTGNSVDADKTVSLSASITLGNANATAAAPITWILDDGTKWSGVDGTLSFMDGVSSHYTVTLRDYNNFVSRHAHRWIFGITNTASNGATLLILGNNFCDGLFQDTGMSASSGRSISGTASKHCCLRNFKIKSGNMDFNGTIRINGLLVFENIDWNHAYTPASGASSKSLLVFSAGAAACRFIGGRLYGSGISDTTPFIAGYTGPANGSLIGAGFTFPRTLIDPVPYASSAIQNPIVFTGSDEGLGGVFGEKGGVMDSRDDGNYPFLNAILPDSAATGWSWRIYPYQNVSPAVPFSALVCNKLYSSAAATKTITVEACFSTGFSGLNTSNAFIGVVYIDDTTGLPVSLTTYDPAGGSLTGSTADWDGEVSDTQVGWGAATLDKKKFSVTTPSSIKQDTQILVTLYHGIQATLASDVIFVCPDVQLT